MPFAIGLRFYTVAILNKETKARVTLGPDGEPCDLFEFVGSFVDSESTPNSEAAKQRSWFFERKDTNSIRSVHGYINYGTHGFEHCSLSRSIKNHSLTNLYNERPSWLDNAHRRLDAAVAAAYGWPADLSDEAILERLFALNQERAAAGR